jgi:oligoendopeptidase F
MTETKKVKQREEIKAEDKWNVEKIYANIEAWDKDLKDLKEKALVLQKYVGKLADPEKLYEYLNVREGVARLAERLFIYAHLKSDEDTSNTTFLSLKDKIDSYLAELKSYEAFFVPEILSLPEGSVEKAIATKKELEIYSFMLQDILNMKPHTLSKEQEELLAAVSDCLEAPSNIFSILKRMKMEQRYSLQKLILLLF